MDGGDHRAGRLTATVRIREKVLRPLLLVLGVALAVGPMVAFVGTFINKFKAPLPIYLNPAPEWLIRLAAYFIFFLPVIYGIFLAKLLFGNWLEASRFRSWDPSVLIVVLWLVFNLIAVCLVFPKVPLRLIYGSDRLVTVEAWGQEDKYPIKIAYASAGGQETIIDSNGYYCRNLRVPKGKKFDIRVTALGPAHCQIHVDGEEAGDSGSQDFRASCAVVVR